MAGKQRLQTNTIRRSQPLQLLRQLEKQGVKTTLQANNSYQFPASDIDQLDISGDHANVSMNVLGLLGVDSPLPHYFQQLSTHETHGSAWSDFLNVFANQVYQLLYLAWKYYRPMLHVELGLPQYLNYLTALSGNLTRQYQQSKYFAYAASLGRHTHSAQTLAGMVGDLLKLPVRVEQAIPVWVDMTIPSTLGVASTELGTDTVLGARCLDSTSKFNLHLGPVDLEGLRSLIPGTDRAGQLVQLLQLYLKPGMEFTLYIHLQLKSNTRYQLGNDYSRLGWSTWLGGSSVGYIVGVNGKNLGLT